MPMNEPEVTPELVERVMNDIAEVTYRSHFDNELSMEMSLGNMEACLSEYFDLPCGLPPEVDEFIDLTMDRIETLEYALKL